MFEKPILDVVKFELKDILTASGGSTGDDTGSETEAPTEVCTTDCPTHSCPNDTGWFG